MNRATIEAINKSNFRAFISVTGGGQNFIGEFLAVEGGSNTILGFYVPYHQDLFNEFIQGKPDTYASDEAARKLAVASYKRAFKVVGGEKCIGIGAASSVASANEREGRVHRLNIAIQTYTRTKSVSIVLQQGRTRDEENTLVSETILQLIAEACGIAPEFPVFVAREKEYRQTTFQTAPTELIEVVNGRRDFLAADDVFANKKLAVFCGSFNPFHEGHAKICEIAEKVTGTKPYVELSVANTDKPFMDFIEIEKRSKDIREHGQRVILTNAPRFVDKTDVLARQNPNLFNMNFELTFIVGADTWLRIWDKKYGVDVLDLINKFKANDVNFLVFSRDGVKMQDYRQVVDNNYYWNDIESLVVLCKEAEDFDMPISSTQLRNNT